MVYGSKASVIKSKVIAIWKLVTRLLPVTVCCLYAELHDNYSLYVLDVWCVLLHCMVVHYNIEYKIYKEPFFILELKEKKQTKYNENKTNSLNKLYSSFLNVCQIFKSIRRTGSFVNLMLRIEAWKLQVPITSLWLTTQLEAFLAGSLVLWLLL